MNDFNNSRLKYIIIILLLQSFLLLYITVWRELDLFVFASDVLIKIFSFIVVGLSILSIIMVKELYRMIKHKADVKIKQIKLEEKERLIKSLRSQKHDFSNHLQTIYGMVQLDKKEEIKEYIKSINQNLVNLKFNQTQTTDSILDSLLISKQIEAKEAGVEFKYQVEEGIDGINLSIDKTFRIVSNLVDNAIDATQKLNNQKCIRVKGIDKNNQFVLSIYNTGLPIEKELLDKIFQAGFSSKGVGRGFGLYIIKSLVEEAGGRLEVESRADFGTEFTCYFPK
ncbi:Spo0B domain-containing protein [Halanaerocella petrolearia]